MYSKTLRTAIVLAVLLSSCALRLPWSDEPVGQEVNVSFVLRENLIVLPSTAMNGRAGTFLLSAAQPRTIVDARFAQASGSPAQYALQLNQKEALQFVPAVEDLKGAADAIIGNDVWGRNAISIDYRSGLLTFQREGIHAGGMTLYQYEVEPMITIVVDGKRLNALLDTTSPDTVVLPRGDAKPHARGHARVEVAQTDFGTIDVGLGDVAMAHVGNRVLSKFLVTIDYGRKEIGLWRDPRIPL